MAYVRNRPTRKEDVSAAVISLGIAAGVGLVTFYVARLLLARESLGTEVARRDETPRSAAE